MRRFIVLILGLLVFMWVGFLFLPEGLRQTISPFLPSVLGPKQSTDSAADWPLLTIEGGAKTDCGQRTDRRSPHGEPAPAVSLEQALSFQMSVPRILGNWPQVSTGIQEDGLFGYRVPLVSGMKENDVTGSLTYFFGSDQVLYRIDFRGDTGDARKLIAHVSQGFQMQRQRASEQGIFLYRTSGELPLVGELRIRPRTIIDTAQPHQRFEVSLQLSRFYSTDADL